VFRASEELPWRGVRELVGDKEGNRPERHCVFADLLPGSVRILPRRHREHRRPAFGFCLLCFRDPEHPSPWDQIKLDWRELSLEARKPHEDQIRIAVGLLEKEST